MTKKLFNIEVTEDENGMRTVTVVPIELNPTQQDVLEALEDCKDNEINN